MEAQPSNDCWSARSVYLRYPGERFQAFYSELTIERTSISGFYVACNFRNGTNGGYFGLRHRFNPMKGAEEFGARFSLWRASTEAIEVLDLGEGVETEGFTEDGTGATCWLEYQWEPAKTYSFLLRCDSTTTHVDFAAFVRFPKESDWRRFARLRRHSGGEGLCNLAAFIEDAGRRPTVPYRKAVFGNQWVCDASGNWKEVATAQFTATKKSSRVPVNKRSKRNEHPTQIGAGVVGSTFYLESGDGSAGPANENQELERLVSGVFPSLPNFE